jgi:predicted RNA-binding Zn-ribbon protein involved in translation (DUF1610 family)
MRGDDTEGDWEGDDPDDWDVEDAEEDLDDDGETAVLPCPACGAEVYEDAERCPRCGEYIVRRLRGWEGRPWWWVPLGLLGIGAVIWALA